MTTLCNGALTAVGSGLSVPVIIVNDTGSTGTEAVGHRVIGRRGVLPATGVRQHRAGTLTLACPTQAAWRALRTVLDTGRVLAFTSTDRAFTEATLMVTTVTPRRLIDGGRVQLVDLEYQAAAEGDVRLEDAAWTWTAVGAGWDDWDELADAFSTYAGLLGHRTGTGVGW